jgi:cytochrome c553
MKKIFFIASIFAFLLLINSCTNNSKQNILSQATCATTNITYLNTIKTIMDNSNCSGCHGAGGTSPELSDYTTVKAAAANASFIGSIKHTSAYSAMPKNADKLDDCTISKLDAWIAAGMPQ